MANIIEIAVGVTGGNIASEALHKITAELEGLASKVPVFGDLVMVAVTATAAISALGGAFFELTKVTADAGDQIWEISKKLGVSAQNVSELKYAAEMSGASLDDLRMAFTLLSRRVNESAQGVEAAQKPFRELGIEVRTASGTLKTSDTLFMESIEKINRLGSETQKTAMMFELFGRSGTSLLPMIKTGTEDINRLREEARRLGITFNDLQAQQANDFNDSLIKLKGSASGLMYTFGKELMPTLTAAFNYLGDVVPKALTVVKDFAHQVAVVFISLPQIFAEVGTVINSIFMHLFTNPDYILGFLTNFLKLGSILVNTFVQMAAELVLIIVKLASIIWVPLGEAASVVFDTLRYDWEVLVQFLESKIVGMADSIVHKLNILLPKAFEFDTAGLDQTLANINEKVIKPPKDMAEAFQEGGVTILGLFDSIKDNAANMGQEFKLAFSGVKEIIKDFADLPEMQLFIRRIEQVLAASEKQFDKFAHTAKVTMASVPSDAEKAFVKLSNIWTAYFDKDMKSLMMHVSKAGKQLEVDWSAVMSNIQEVSRATWATFKQGVGDAIGSAIVYGEDLGKAFNNLMLKIAAGVISMLVQIGLQMLIQWALGLTLLVTETTAKLGALFAIGMLASAAWGAMTGGPIGAAAAALAFIPIGITAIAEGTVTGQALGPVAAGAGAAHGGLDYVPSENTYLLDKGERVLSPRQNEDLKSYMRENKTNAQTSTIVIQQLQIMPYASIDEALMSKPREWWVNAIKKNILPALDTLGDRGYTTTLTTRKARI